MRRNGKKKWSEKIKTHERSRNSHKLKHNTSPGNLNKIGGVTL